MKLRRHKKHYTLEVRVAKKTLWLTVASFLLGLALVIAASVWFNSTRIYHYPLSEKEPSFTPTPTPEPVVEAKSQAREKGQILEGWATWYGTGANECLGCNPERIMANGQRLDDDALTVACNDFPLGTRLVIQNLREDGTGRIVEAIVTDRHGSNIIVDMTKAVRDAIGCKGKCWVRLWPIEEGEI